MTASRTGEILPRRQTLSAASANNSPRKKLSSLISAAVVGWPAATCMSLLRISAGYGRTTKASRRTRGRAAGPVNRTRAASIPSIDVPDINPTTHRPDFDGGPRLRSSLNLLLLSLQMIAEFFKFLSELLQCLHGDFSAGRRQSLLDQTDAIESLRHSAGGNSTRLQSIS